MGWFSIDNYDKVSYNDEWFEHVSEEDLELFAIFFNSIYEYIVENILHVFFYNQFDVQIDYIVKQFKEGKLFISSYEPCQMVVNGISRSPYFDMHINFDYNKNNRIIQNRNWRFYTYFNGDEKQNLDNYRKDIGIYWNTHKDTLETLWHSLYLALFLQIVDFEQYVAVTYNIDRNGFIMDYDEPSYDF